MNQITSCLVFPHKCAGPESLAHLWYGNATTVVNSTPYKTYETHLTLDSHRSGGIESARAWAIKSGLKWTEIELSHGEHQLQPMITFWSSDPLESQRKTAKQIEEQLQPLGLQVVRFKTETAASEAQVAESGQYFECHVKLHLKSSEDWDALLQVAHEKSAHVSRNARKVREDGTHERFLTLRSYECDGVEAQNKVKDLIAGLNAHGLNIMETESEFVVFDSNLSMDDGWEVANV